MHGRLPLVEFRDHTIELDTFETTEEPLTGRFFNANNFRIDLFKERLFMLLLSV